MVSLGTAAPKKRLLVEKQPNSLRIFARRVDTMLKLAESAYFRLIFLRQIDQILFMRRLYSYPQTTSLASHPQTPVYESQFDPRTNDHAR